MKTLMVACLLASMIACPDVATAKTVPLPDNTKIDCSAFQRRGALWHLVKDTTITVGSTQNVSFENIRMQIGPGSIHVGGTTPAGEDFFDVLETKCGQ